MRRVVVGVGCNSEWYVQSLIGSEQFSTHPFGAAFCFLLSSKTRTFSTLTWSVSTSPPYKSCALFWFWSVLFICLHIGWAFVQKGKGCCFPSRECLHHRLQRALRWTPLDTFAPRPWGGQTACRQVARMDTNCGEPAPRRGRGMGAVVCDADGCGARARRRQLA